MTWIMIFVGAALVLVYLIYGSVNERLKAMETRMNIMQETISQLTAEGQVTEPAINEELRRLVKDGKTVEAVKKARKAFGLSLLEAKRYVDDL
ncbi:hypothetical protein [Planococcus salinus]|nr:hypothetical protein [Planococcus salinus]